MSLRGIVNSKAYQAVLGRAEHCQPLSCKSFSKCKSGKYTYAIVHSDRGDVLVHLRRIFSDLELRASHRCFDFSPDDNVVIAGECIIDHEHKTLVYNFRSGTYSMGIMRKARSALSGFTSKLKHVDTSHLTTRHVVVAVYRAVVESVVARAWTTRYTSQGLFLPNIDAFNIHEECREMKAFVQTHAVLNGKPLECNKF